MGLRFRRSIGLIPGIRLNFGKRGVSMSVGPRGAKVTIGPTGTRGTVGLPGTGLSYTEKLDGHHDHQADTVADVPSRPAEYESAPPRSSGFAALGWIVAAVLFVLLILALS